MRFTVIILALTAAAACQTASDCSLNGDCTAGTCKCDPWWSGSPTCDVLSFLPTPFNTGYNMPSSANGSNSTSWGGLPLVDESGTWHLFVAEMVNDCGLWTWKNNSRISRATGPAQNGPFSFAKTVVLPFAHNPKAIRAPDGTYLIYFIGSWETSPQVCAAMTDVGDYSQDMEPMHGEGDYPGPTHDTCGPYPLNGGCGLAVASSTSLLGPWDVSSIIIQNQNTSALLDCAHTNPSPFFFDNGSMVMLFNAGYCHANLETIGILEAPSWRGPYTLRSPDPIFMDADGTPHTCEDPSLWIDERGWHAMVHNFDGGRISLYAHSLDGYAWTLHGEASNPGPYNGTVLWSDGSSSHYDLQRPQLVFDPVKGTPTYMVNGATVDEVTGRSFTLFRPLRQQ